MSLHVHQCGQLDRPASHLWQCRDENCAAPLGKRCAKHPFPSQVIGQWQERTDDRPRCAVCGGAEPRQPVTCAVHVSNLTNAAQLADRARKVLALRDDAIRATYAEVQSYRKLAEATKLSPAGIARIVKR